MSLVCIMVNGVLGRDHTYFGVVPLFFLFGVGWVGLSIMEGCW